MSKRQMSPLPHSSALRSSSLRQMDSGWRSCSVPQAGGRVLCQQNLQVILRSCRAAGGGRRGASHPFLFPHRTPCMVSVQSEPQADFLCHTHRRTDILFPPIEGSLSCTHKHLERMHLVGSLKRWLDRFHCFNEASCKPLKIRKFHI